MSTDIDVLKLEMRPHLKRSVTTLAGNVAGTTLIDNTLTEPDDFWNGMAILIRTAGATVDCSGQLRRVLDWDLATNTLTVNVPFTDPLHPADPKIEAGVQYVMFFPTIIPTEDTGLNTNPRRYEKLHGIVTLPVLSGPTPIWAVGVVALNPVGGRTAGLVTTVYALVIENSTGAAVTAWLEDNLGVPITPLFHIANNDSVVIPLDAGGNFGDMDLYFNASVASVSCQLFGTEE